MKLVDREAFSLSLLFIREAIYLSLRRAGVERGLLSFISNLFLPSINDSVVTYNLKWFVSGLLSGILISLWIPLMINLSRTVGAHLVTLFLVAYMVMVMLISILITTDLIHQVLASINELGLWRRLEYLPFKKETIEKAASYSVLNGGGLALLLGMGLAVGLIIYLFTDLALAILMLPIGFTSSTLLVYPLIIYLTSKFGGRTPPVVSLLIHVSITVLILSAYLNTLAFSSVTEVYEFLETYKLVFPFPYIHVVMSGPELASLSAVFGYFAAGLSLSIVVPSKYGIRLLTAATSSRGLSLNLSFPRLISVGFKDVLLLIRDATRQKQFYGQIAALSTPFAITMLSRGFLEIVHGMEYVRALFLVSLYGLVAYISATIVSPVLLFMEADRNRVLYSLPLSLEDVAVSKTVASTILFQPAPLIMLALSSALISPVHGLSIYYVSIIYWMMSSYISLRLYLNIMWGKLGAWTEFSVGVIKRVGLMILSVIPLGVLLLVIMPIYIFEPTVAYALLLTVPLPIALYALIRALLAERTTRA